MSDDHAREQLALELLNPIFADYERTKPEKVFELEDGRNGFVFSGESKKGFGTFRCEFVPFAAVVKIISECEQLYDRVMPRRSVNQVSSASRGATIKAMVILATSRLLIGLTAKLGNAVEDNFHESMLLAGVALQGSLAEIASDYAKESSVDCRPVIEHNVEIIAKRTRKDLRALLSLGVPRLILPHGGPGRPKGSKKSAKQTALEAAEFEKQIEETIRSLRRDQRKMPTKTAVAKHLGIGGVNIVSGVDSSLTSFSRKVKRLKVDFDAIVKRVRLGK